MKVITAALADLPDGLYTCRPISVSENVKITMPLVRKNAEYGQEGGYLYTKIGEVDTQNYQPSELACALTCRLLEPARFTDTEVLAHKAVFDWFGVTGLD